HRPRRRPWRACDALPARSGGAAARGAVGAATRGAHDRGDARLGHGAHYSRAAGAQGETRAEVARGRALSAYTDVRNFMKHRATSRPPGVASDSTSAISTRRMHRNAFAATGTFGLSLVTAVRPAVSLCLVFHISKSACICG